MRRNNSKPKQQQRKTQVIRSPITQSLGKSRVGRFRTRMTCVQNDSNAGGAGSQAVSFFQNYPTYFRNPSGSIAMMTVVPDSYANEFKMFDEYKVHSLTVKYIPWSNYSTWVNAGTSLDPSAYWTVDQDDSALITSFFKGPQC